MVVAYARVQAEMELKRTLADWLVVRPASFLASPTYVHNFLLERLLPDAQINQNADAYLFPGYLPLLLAAVALLWPAPAAPGLSRQSSRWTRAALAADIAFLASATFAVVVSIGGPVRLKLGTVVIFSARESWRAWSVAAVSGAVRLAIARRAPFQAVPRIVDVVKGFTRWLAGRRRDATLFYLLLVLVSVELSIGPPFGLWPARESKTSGRIKPRRCRRLIQRTFQLARPGQMRRRAKKARAPPRSTPELARAQSTAGS